MRSTNASLSATTLCNTLTGAGHAGIEIHSVDTNCWIVLDTKIDVLGNTETKVASLREVALAKLVLLDLEATLENLLCLWTTDGNVDSNFLVTTDTECTDSVASLAYFSIL